MADDNHSDPKSHLIRPMATRPHDQQLDHADSRKRADRIGSHRQPTDVPVIRQRLKEVLQREIEMKRLVDAFPLPSAPLATKPNPVTPNSVTPNSGPKIETKPASIPKSIVNNDQSNAKEDNVLVEPIISENGFKIFKSRKDIDEQKDAATSINLDTSDDDQINKTVDPVPMGADAIEEALKLISDDVQEKDDLNHENDEANIGFIPVSMNPGTFGAEVPPAENAEKDDLIQVDDEQLINDILSADTTTPSEPEASDENTSGPALHVVDKTDIAEPVSATTSDKIQHWQIGQAMASSIRGIVKDEVDTALDKMAREAVREVLSTYR